MVLPALPVVLPALFVLLMAGLLALAENSSQTGMKAKGLQPQTLGPTSRGAPGTTSTSNSCLLLAVVVT